MKVVFFATPEFAAPSLGRLVASRHEVALVVSKPDRPAGRGRRMNRPPVVELAERYGLRTLQPSKLKDPGLGPEIRSAEARLGVVVAYGKLIPKQILELFPDGLVNLHPSLLPRHRGPSPIQWTLVCGDRRTGVTTMLIDEGMDTGPILLQREVPVDPGETAEQLAPRLAVLGAELLVETLDGLEEGRVTPRPQPDEGASVSPMLRRSFAEVDWRMPAHQLVNRLRGFTPWPGLHTAFRGGLLKLHGLEEVQPPPPGDEDPGSVLEVGPGGIVVRCGRRSAVRITELQREGRRRLPVDAFLIGERVVSGERLG